MMLQQPLKHHPRLISASPAWWRQCQAIDNHKRLRRASITTMFLRGRGLQLFRSITPGVRTEIEVALRNNHKFLGGNRCLPVEAGPEISPCRRLGLQKRYFGYENYPKWPPYTLDKHGQVKQKKLTKQAGHMLNLIEQELAETSPVSREKVINADFEVGDSVEVKFYNNFSTCHFSISYIFYNSKNT